MQEKLRKGKEIFADKLDLPKEVILNMPIITILGDEEITIENHKGIDSFDNNMIKINTKATPIVIKGNDFEILYIGENTITLSGKFDSIVYERV